MHREPRPDFAVYISGRDLIKAWVGWTGYSVVDGHLIGPDGDTGCTCRAGDFYGPDGRSLRCEFDQRWIRGAIENLPAGLLAAAASDTPHPKPAPPPELFAKSVPPPDWAPGSPKAIAHQELSRKLAQEVVDNLNRNVRRQYKMGEFADPPANDGKPAE